MSIEVGVEVDETLSTELTLAPTIHPNLKLLSYSSSVLLHKCARKYELYKLSPRSWKNELKAITNHEELSNVAESEVHLDFGSVVGIGTQEFLVSGSMDKAIFSMFIAWEMYLENEDGNQDKKNFWYALYALDRFVTFRLTALNGYSVAIFDGKPAIELGYIIDCGNGFTHRGFLDSLLIHDKTKVLLPYEGKTTKFRNVHEAVYKNSGQALGYSLITDAIARRMGMVVGSSFDVLYSVYKSSVSEWEQFRFTKSHTDRALWIKNILLDIRRIEEFASIEYFPMQGENCFDFFRPCEHFGTCHMSNAVLFSGPNGIPIKKDDDSKYQFRFSLEEIIQTQIEKQELVGSGSADGVDLSSIPDIDTSDKYLNNLADVEVQ